MIHCEHIDIRMGSFALNAVEFTVETGSYTVLMGASGCGKTTLLECICGLRRPQRGRIIVNGRDITHLPPRAREIGYVPQDRALFPGLPVADQLAYALRIRGCAERPLQERVQMQAESLGLSHLLTRSPEQLSGGEAQRVALGRALICQPRVLLLDEPLSAVDSQRREEICVHLERLHAQGGITILHITHDPSEAHRLSTHRLSLRNGKVSPELP